MTSRRFGLSHNYSFSPNVLNVTSFTYGRYRNPSLATAADGNWPQKLGLGDIGPGNFPEIDFGNSVNGVETTAIGYSSSGFYVSNAYIVNDSLTWMRGRHTLKFGGEIRFLEINSHAGFPTLQFNFTNNQTGAPGMPYAKAGRLRFRQFLARRGRQGLGNTSFDFYGRRKTYSVFAQDDFKVSRKLTLTMGLRWDATGPFREKYGHWANFDPAAYDTSWGYRPLVFS